MYRTTFALLALTALAGCEDDVIDGAFNVAGRIVRGVPGGAGSVFDAGVHQRLCASEEYAPLEMRSTISTVGRPDQRAPLPPDIIAQAFPECAIGELSPICRENISNATLFLNPAAEWRVTATVPPFGDGCYRDSACELPVGRLRFGYRWNPNLGLVEALMHPTCDILARPGADLPALLQRTVARMQECASDAGIVERLSGGDIRYSFMGLSTFTKTQIATCMMQVCADANRWPTPDYQVPNPDEDNLGPACDCAEPEGDDARCTVQPQAHGPFLPGYQRCPPDHEHSTCTVSDEWPDWQTFATQQIHRGPMRAGAGLAEDLGAEQEYTFEDEIACPPDRQCWAATSRQRGRDYEEWLCRRQKRRNPGTLCNNGRGSPAAPGYRTAAGQWELPPELPHDRARQMILPEGRLRFPDFYVPPHPRNHRVEVFGEAKCYNPFIAWDRSRVWSWFSAVGFGTQLVDYINKMMEGRRTGHPRTVAYYFCDLLPQWTNYEVAAALAWTGANGFDVHVRDSPPGANWIRAPGCYVDMADALYTVAPSLFQCFVPGEIAPDGVDPRDSCIGAFYDQCSGSE